VPDLLKVLFEITLHFNGDPVLKQLFLLGEQLRRQFPETLFSEFAVSRAAKVHFGIDQLMPAFFAAPGGLILKKFYRIVANGAANFIDGSRLPIAAVLSRAFHCYPPTTLATEFTENTEK
jgi:hypothetical protein